MNVGIDNEPRRHRLTVDDYHRMAEVGLLPPDARVELIEGEIIDMAPIGSEHGAIVDWLAEHLIPAAKSTAIVRVQGAIRLGTRSEPEPDIAVLKRRPDRYAKSQPSANDVLLVIEVSDTTLRHDLEKKGPLYAHHGIPEYWVIDIPARRVHVFRAPWDGAFAETSVVERGVLQVPVLGIELEVASLLV
ncbi:MAG TPA: Uma2 family endonuclease [Gammaproteobacteria bacterium]|nr:Uma2 family endonuclease [Gammaproteobacteria bacterium]